MEPTTLKRHSRYWESSQNFHKIMAWLLLTLHWLWQQAWITHSSFLGIPQNNFWSIMMCYNIVYIWSCWSTLWYKLLLNPWSLNETPVYWITTLCLQTPSMSFQFGTPCQMIVSLLPILGYSNLIFCQLISLYSVNYTHFAFSIWQYISANIVSLLAIFAIYYYYY